MMTSQPKDPFDDTFPRGDENYSVPPLNLRNSNGQLNDELPMIGRQPSITRRLSQQLSRQMVRHPSVGNVGNSMSNMTSYIPGSIANAVPFLNNNNNNNNNVTETYFCQICFMNNAKKDGFKLSNCNHTFCTECIKGYWTSRIEIGNVYLKCFHPMPENGDQYCGKEVNELDILQVVNSEVAEKYHRFKENLENPNARQCPKCQHTQTGDPNNPIITCEKCSTQYCLYHSAAHSVEERCEAYESRMLKEDKLNQEVTKDAKGCPRCKYLIEKSGGCNHMKCIKCNCSFCWLCMQEIEDIPIPSHFKSGNSACAGKQFEGMEGELPPPPPRWLVIIMVFFACIFAIPALVIALPLACICFPCVWCGETLFLESWEERECTFTSVLSGCWIGWLLFFLFIIIIVPLTIIVGVVKNVLGRCGIRVCSDLDEYNQQLQRQGQQQQQQQQQLIQQNPNESRVSRDSLQEDSVMQRALRESAEEHLRELNNNANTSNQINIDIQP